MNICGKNDLGSYAFGGNLAVCKPAVFRITEEDLGVFSTGTETLRDSGFPGRGSTGGLGKQSPYRAYFTIAFYEVFCRLRRNKDPQDSPSCPICRLAWANICGKNDPGPMAFTDYQETYKPAIFWQTGFEFTSLFTRTQTEIVSRFSQPDRKARKGNGA